MNGARKIHSSTSRNPLRILGIIFLIGFLIPSFSMGQDTLASDTADSAAVTLGAPMSLADSLDRYKSFFDTLKIEETCDKFPRRQYCIDLDAKASVDPMMPDLIFEWEVSEGDVMKGLEVVKVCFDTPGPHEIWLNTIDPSNGVKSMHDTLIVVDFNGKLPFTVEGPMRESNPVTFTTGFHDDDSTKSFVWHFGTDYFRLGKRVIHPFNEAGEFTVRVFELKDENGEIEILTCKTAPVRIKSFFDP